MQRDKLIYWDSCAFIHLFQQTERYFEVLDDIKARAQRKECKIITSAVSLAEVCKIPETGMLPIAIEEAKKATRQSKKLRDVIKFQNAVIGINKKIQKAVLARTLGMGGDGMLRENLAKLDVLCKKQQKGKNG